MGMDVVGTKSKKLNNTVDSWLLRPQTEFEKEKFFSSDELIDAYFKGRRDQVEESKKVLLKIFSDNLKRAQQTCEDFFAALEKNGVKGFFVSLKAESVTIFDAIFVVPTQKFLTHDFDAVYKMAREKKKELVTTTFNISFSFMPLTDSLDEEQMLMDGYILKYGKV
ncbi:MAG: hypothetical protein LBC59_00740 [Chitinispirillales bacterium]|jgi:hypothetical protein|nr:hypothetical protein [Chitinispirillales bacterium]